MKKTLFALLLVSSTLAWGDCGSCCYEQPCRENSYCECCGEPQPNQCLDIYGYNPPYYHMNCGCGILMGADFLYWYGRERDLEIGTINLQIATQTGPEAFLTTAPADIIYSHAAWDPGVRVFLGCSSACDGWDLLLAWTYYRNCQKTKESVPPIEGLGRGAEGILNLTTPWSAFVQTFFDLLNTLKSTWRVRYNDIELQLGRRYWVSPWCTLRPHLGLRAPWIDTNFNVDGNREVFLDRNGAGVSIVSETKFDNGFWGIGFRAGIEPRFYFTSCFSLFGGFGASLLWGKFKMDRSTIFEEIIFTSERSGIPTVLDFKTEGEKYGMQAILDVELGLRYEMAFCDRRYFAFLEAGWEHHYFFNHVSRIRFFDLPRSSQVESDLMFGGFVLRAGFPF